MIKKQYIGSTAEALHAYLKGLTDYFSEVQLDSNTITCKDNDGNTVFQISVASNGEVNKNFYTALSSISDTTTSLDKLELIGWQCKNGVFLDIHYTSGGKPSQQYGILITKNNHGKLLFVASCYRTTPFYKNLYIISWDDDMPLDQKLNFEQVVSTQTMFCPFTSKAKYGETSYTPNAFYMPVWQGYTGFGEFIAEGVRFWTNGYWAIRDE